MYQCYLKKVFLAAACFYFWACLPHLDKYRDPQGAHQDYQNPLSEPVSSDLDQDTGNELEQSSDRGVTSLNAGKTGRMASISPSAIGSSKKRPSGSAPLGRGQASIYAVDQKTIRFLVRDDDVWNAALNVLIRNYNVNIVDRTSGIITTEWDSYFLNNRVYRNKLTVHMTRAAWNIVDMTFHNNVERLQDGSSAGTVGAVWLPAEDSAKEIHRVVQNMALVLNQPPPVLPPVNQTAASLESK